MSDLTNKDAEQDSKLAVLESKIESFRERIHALEAETSNVSVIDSTLENAIRRIEMVHSRIDKTEEKLKALDNELRGRIRKAEMWIAGAGAVIAAATTIIGIAVSVESQEINYGRNDSPQQEVMLQLSSDRD
jgi:chromosome segregation ATPase|tara:strand:- start:88 stop:483 length:396 start_codon:yes stop_codon:yes gene_type:complete